MASKDALKNTLRDDFERAGKSVVGAGSLGALDGIFHN